VAAVVVTLALVAKIYSEGAQSVQDKGLKDTLSAIKEKKKIEADVNTTSDDDVRKRMRDNNWTRD
tara:strand:- start:856 stop:1050 length:195 start_codon:yes stop_codon:yes gene_type:complete